MLHNTLIYEYQHSPRVVIIGDVHGDLKRFKNILKDANIINDDLEWIASPPDTIIVQLGDQVDSLNRNPNIGNWEVLEDWNMLYFTNSLHNIAKEKGGKLISLIGNHELMNVIGDFSYVSPQSKISDRIKYFQPTGTLSTILAYRPIVLKIGKLFFCHAGIKQNHIEILERKNKPIEHLNEIWKNYILTGTVLTEDHEIFQKIILDMNGILWNRELDDNIGNVLQKLGCEYMFIGHNPVESIHIQNDKIWLVDTCISRAFGSKSYEYVDIENYSISVKTITEN
jgi:hypothetical protein